MLKHDNHSRLNNRHNRGDLNDHLTLSHGQIIGKSTTLEGGDGAYHYTVIIMVFSVTSVIMSLNLFVAYARLH